MENNPTQPTEPTPAPAPAPAPEAQPAQPAQPVTATAPNGQPITYAQKAPKQPMDPAKKKTLIMALCIGGGVLVLGLIALVVCLAIFKVDYDADYDKLKDLSKAVDVFTDGGDYCYKVKSASRYTDASEYGGYVTNCKEELEKGFAAFTEIGNLNSVKRNDKMAEQYKAASEAFSTLKYNANSIDSVLNVYKALQGFYATLDTSYASYASWSSLSEDDLEKAAAYLTTSGEESLASFGTKWLEAAKKARTAYVKYYKDDTGTYADYRAADNAYDDVCDDAPDTDDLTSLLITGADETKFDKAISNIKSIAAENLSDNYYNQYRYLLDY